jgi:hypothetical protein
MKLEHSLPCSQGLVKSCVTFRNVLSFCPPHNTQARGPPLVDLPRLLIQYIRSYPSYLEALLSIRDLRARHAVVIRTYVRCEMHTKF